MNMFRHALQNWQQTTTISGKKITNMYFKNQNVQKTTRLKKQLLAIYNSYKTKRMVFKKIKQQDSYFGKGRGSSTFNIGNTWAQLVGNNKVNYHMPHIIHKCKTKINTKIYYGCNPIKIELFSQISALFEFNRACAIQTLLSKLSFKKEPQNTHTTVTTYKIKHLVFETLFNFDNSISSRISTNYTPNFSQLLTSTHLSKTNSNVFVTLLNATQNNSNNKQQTATPTKIHMAITRHHHNHHELNNYLPLFFFPRTVGVYTTDECTRIRTRHYYYTIGHLQTTKYKNFFNFFLINFLENFLLKKI
jgi:hypothetical protein